MPIIDFWSLPYPVHVTGDYEFALEMEAWCSKSVVCQWDWEFDIHSFHFRFECLNSAIVFKTLVRLTS